MAEAGVQSYDYNHSRAGAAIPVSATHSREPLSQAPFLLSPAGETLLVAKRECQKHSWRSFLSVRLRIQTTRHTFSSHPHYSTHVASLQDSTGNFSHPYTLAVSWILGCAAFNGGRRSFHGIILLRIQIVTDMLFLDYIPWFLGVVSFLFFSFLLYPHSGGQDPWSCLETGEHRGRYLVDVVNSSANKANKCTLLLFGSVSRLWICFQWPIPNSAPGVGL